LDNSLKTPYSYTLDFSVGRQLPKGFAFEVSYVGRLSHRLLAQSDLAMPLDLVDQSSKADYFAAATALAKAISAGGAHKLDHTGNGWPHGSLLDKHDTAAEARWNYSLFCSGGPQRIL